MPVDRNYSRALEKLEGPRITNDFVVLAQRLFDIASGDAEDSEVYPQSRFSDHATASQAYWEAGTVGGPHYERIAVNLAGRGLLIALDHRHDDELFESGHAFTNHPRTTLVLGHQRPKIWSTTMRGMTKRDALREKETILPAFKHRLDHAMAAVGLGAVMHEVAK